MLATAMENLGPMRLALPRICDLQVCDDKKPWPQASHHRTILHAVLRGRKRCLLPRYSSPWKSQLDVLSHQSLPEAFWDRSRIPDSDDQDPPRQQCSGLQRKPWSGSAYGKMSTTWIHMLVYHISAHGRMLPTLHQVKEICRIESTPPTAEHECSMSRTPST
jgi:hypothetical protein